jgi:hypothetical protein
MKRQVDFFIVGAQKAGTTALAYMLNQHPEICIARDKETHYFDNEDNINWSQPDYSDFHSEFNWSKGHKRYGDATPIYLFWPNAMERISNYNQHAKIIAGLRHPAYRAYSHWRMEMSRGNETLEFDQAISQHGRARLLQSNRNAQRLFSYIERGFYSGQVERLLKLFPRSRIFLYRTDHLWAEPNLILESILQFLNISANPVGLCQRSYHPPTYNYLNSAMTEDNIQSLLNLYSLDIRLTQDITGIDLSDWQDLRYREPMKP